MKPKQAELKLAAAQEAKAKMEDELLPLPNVNGVGVGYKETDGKTTKTLAVVVYVTKKEKNLPKKDQVPDEIHVPEMDQTVKTDVKEIGEVVAQAFTARIRPARFSVGHFNITAGTFGCLVRDRCEPCTVHLLRA